MSRTRTIVGLVAIALFLILAAQADYYGLARAAQIHGQVLAVQPGALAGQHVIHQPGPALAATVLAKIKVPDLPDDANFLSATNILRESGLTVGKFRCDQNSSKPGAVVGRATGFLPASGTLVAPGSKVDIYAIQAGDCGGTIFIQPAQTMAHHTGPGAHPAPPPPPPPPVQAAPPPVTAAPGGAPAGNPGETAAENASATIETGTDEAPVDGAQKGFGAFVDPGDMNVGSWHTLEFVVGPTKKALAGETEDQQLTPPRDIYVAPQMKVTLLPNRNFDIEQIGDAIQNTGKDLTASWQWNINPKTDGDQQLEAQVEVGQTQSDGSFKSVESYKRRVPIKVRVGTWQGFLNALKNAATLGDALGTLFRSWEKTVTALTLLVVAIFGLWFTIKRRGKPETGA
jgi:hypothetical protein